MNLTNLRTIVRQLTSTTLSSADGGSLSGGDASFTDTMINLHLTNGAHLLTTEIIQGNDDWDFQGERATASLVANQREYIFPTDILLIKRIEAKLDGTNAVRLKPINESEIKLPLTDESDITRRFDNVNPYFGTIEKGFYIYSGTIPTVSNGLEVWYTKEIVGRNNSGADITSFSATTDTPNIAAAFQEGLCYFAAKKFFEGIGILERAQDMDNELEKILVRMRAHYAQRIEPRGMRMKGQGDLQNFE